MSLDNANWKQTGHHANDVNIQAPKHVYLVAGASGGSRLSDNGGGGGGGGGGGLQKNCFGPFRASVSSKN